MHVSITELRANLASILDEVDSGTTVTITDRGKVRATIVPVAPTSESVVDRGLREGWLSVGPGYYNKRANRRPRVTISAPPGVRLDDIIAQDRGDR